MDIISKPIGLAFADQIDAAGLQGLCSWNNVGVTRLPTTSDANWAKIVALVAAHDATAPLITPTQALLNYAAAKRFTVETGGVALNGLHVATDRDSQAMIANAYAGMVLSGATTIKFKAASGWVDLSFDQIKAVALAVYAHVQAAFAVENTLDTAILATPPTVTSAAQIDAAAWPSLPA